MGGRLKHSWMWLLWLGLLWLAPLACESQGIGVGFLPANTCFTNLTAADIDGDQRIDREEYVLFVQARGPAGFLSNVMSFSMLPLVLQGNFLALACLCTQPPFNLTDSCCTGSNAHIDISGITAVNPTEGQTQYLVSVCVTSASAVAMYVASITPTGFPTMPPSFIPTLPPSLTVMPSSLPTLVASSTPTVEASITPTVARSGTPSSVPSGSPSFLPSTEPTLVPSVVPSSAPSLSPSSSPSTNPTMEDSVTPSSAPSLSPSTSPTVEGSVEPTTAPTGFPSLFPSLFPTTIFPSMFPTLVPSTSIAPTPSSPVPSIEPSLTLVPSAPPTPAPTTMTPTQEPTPAPVTPFPSAVGVVIVNASYTILIENGTNGIPPTRNQVLIEAMDGLVPTLLSEEFPGSRLRRRRLVVTFSSPSSVVGFENTLCPDSSDLVDLCQDVSHVVTLVTDENVTEVEQNFTSALNQAILDGRLETDPPIRVLTPESPTGAPLTGGDDTLTSGIVSGAGAITVLALAGYFLYRRRQNRKDEAAASGFPSASSGTLGDGGGGGDDAGGGAAEAEVAVDARLGATAPNYRQGRGSKKSVQKFFEGIDTEDPATRTPEPVDGGDSSSNAGSSGWSSGFSSSHNPGSVDESVDYPGPVTGTSLATITKSSGITADSESVPSVPQVTREDLDSAIEAGDWAAVGATAALLAAASDSQSYSSRSRRSGTSYSRDGTSVSSLDAARAAELDHLVDAGDWEGVVLAAAKFEASEDASTGASQTQESSHVSGTTTGSHSTSLSESPSKIARRDEIREEVEALVRRVVPEEIDNVDEMMLQFKGREEELVETLRTMQERQIAQKARVQGQKRAKRDAREIAKDGGIDLPVPGAAPATDESQDVGASTQAGIAIATAAAKGVAAGLADAMLRRDDDDEEEDDEEEEEDIEISDTRFESEDVPPTLGTEETRNAATLSEDSASDRSGSDKRRRTALELAIEAGDWEAVGEAAAMMSDNSVTSSGSTGGTSSQDVSSSKRFRVDAEKAAQLDEMIDKGDWSGVVAAASRFSSERFSSTDEEGRVVGVDTTGVGTSASGTVGSSSRAATAGTSESSVDTDERLKEENEALAQAEIWMAIAEQSKQDGVPDAGASEAADWAIARSLSALRQAEEQGELKSGESEVSAATENEEGSQDRSV